MNRWFNRFATKVSEVTGHSYAFSMAVFVIVVWIVTGPIMRFSDTWQLLINTLTTLITFLMVFVIQNGQNRSDYSSQIKLDLILQMLGVNDEDVRRLEELDDKQLEKILEAVREGKTASAGTKLIERKVRRKTKS